MGAFKQHFPLKQHQIDPLVFGFARSFEKKIEIMRSPHQQNLLRVKNKRVLPHHQQATDKIFIFI